MGGEEVEPIAPCRRLQAAFSILGKRWNGQILDTIARRPARFTEIHRAVPGLSDRILGERLRELVDCGLVVREVGEHNVALYRLTERGERLRPGLEEIRAWGGVLLEATEHRAGAHGRASRTQRQAMTVAHRHEPA